MDMLQELKTLIREKMKVQKKYDELAEEAIDPALEDFFKQRKNDELMQQKLLADKLTEILNDLEGATKHS